MNKWKLTGMRRIHEGPKSEIREQNKGKGLINRSRVSRKKQKQRNKKKLVLARIPEYYRQVIGKDNEVESAATMNFMYVS